MRFQIILTGIAEFRSIVETKLCFKLTTYY